MKRDISIYLLGAAGVVASVVGQAACGSSDSGSPAGGLDAGTGSGSSGSSGASGSSSGAGGGGSGVSGASSGTSPQDGGSSSGSGSSGAGGGSSGATSGSSGSGSSGGGSSGSGSSSGASPTDAGGTAVTHTMAECDTLAAADSELALPLTKTTKITKPALPATPTTPACILSAAVSGPNEAQTAADTARIAAALANAACPVVKLVAAGANNAFISGALDIIGPKTLWVDSGVTLYASVNAASFAYAGRTQCGAQHFDQDCAAMAGTQCTALINMTGQGPQLVGGGTLDGQGGKPIIVGGMQQTYSWWDLSVALRGDTQPDAGDPGNCATTPPTQRGGSAPNPQLIIGGASAAGKSDHTTANMVVAGLTLRNSPKFHIKFASAGFTIWGNTILTPSDKTVPPINARNTDGIDPGEGWLATNGAVVCNMISTGDDDIVLKGHYGVGNVVVAHNHFGTGHGMSIGSETQGTGVTGGVGVQDVNIYDISIDGDTRSTGGAPGSDVNGVRVKSDTYRGGVVQNVTFHDICERDIVNPLMLNPHYSAKTISPPLIPFFKSITVKNLSAFLGNGPDGPVTPIVTLQGYDAAHPTAVTLDNVLVQGIAPANVLSDAFTTVTIPAGSPGTNFAAPPSLTTAGTATGISCDWGWPVPRPQ